MTQPTTPAEPKRESVVTAFRADIVRPNPFRDIDRYPIDREKIAALRASIQSTGFWDNVVARVVDGRPEIAYGHHRMVAVREELGESAEINLIVRDLDDETMLRIMADENMQEWTSSAAIEQETIAAVVRAYADGRITLDAPNGKTNGLHLRYAPSYRAGDDTRANGHHPYTKETVAAFLRWPVAKVERALTALSAIEADEVPPEAFRDLGSTISERVVQAAHAAERKAKARGIAPAAAKDIGRTVATRLADDFRGGSPRAIGTAITEQRNRIIEEVLPSEETAAVPADVAEALYREIEGFWRKGIGIRGRGTLTRTELIRLVAANRDAKELRGVGRPWNEQLALALVEMARVATDLADDLVAEDALAVAR